MAANPAARDTLRGIIEWWLLKQKIMETGSDVEAAVVSLVAKGKLRAHVGVDGRVSYSLPQEHHKSNGSDESFHGDN